MFVLFVEFSKIDI